MSLSQSLHLAQLQRHSSFSIEMTQTLEAAAPELSRILEQAFVDNAAIAKVSFPQEPSPQARHYSKRPYFDPISQRLLSAESNPLEKPAFYCPDQSEEGDVLNTQFLETNPEALPIERFTNRLSLTGSAERSPAAFNFASLEEYVMHQLRCEGLSNEEMRRAEIVLSYLDAQGILHTPPDQIELETSLDEQALIQTSALLQDLDPPGLAAPSLEASVQAQLLRAGIIGQLENQIVTHIFAHEKMPSPRILAKTLQVSPKEIEGALEKIRGVAINFRALFDPSQVHFASPELRVEKDGERLIVETVAEKIPRIEVSAINESLPIETQRFMRERRAKAKQLENCLRFRNEALVSVAQAIVDAQHDYLTGNQNTIVPLSRNTIAERVGLSESTVCRAVFGKLIDTPRGVLRLSSFFDIAIPQIGGGTVSRSAARKAVGEIIAEESSDAPLSDEAIGRAMKGQGFAVARRTIAKYRFELGIPPAVDRKR